MSTTYKSYSERTVEELREQLATGREDWMAYDELVARGEKLKLLPRPFRPA